MCWTRRSWSRRWRTGGCTACTRRRTARGGGATLRASAPSLFPEISMSVTEKLLRVFRVDQQLRGLQGRLGGAERFLEEQTRQLRQVEAKRDAAAAQLRQLRATIADHEGEMARLDAKLAAIREQMNSAKTNK